MEFGDCTKSIDIKWYQRLEPIKIWLTGFNSWVYLIWQINLCSHKLKIPRVKWYNVAYEVTLPGCPFSL